MDRVYCEADDTSDYRSHDIRIRGRLLRRRKPVRFRGTAGPSFGGEFDKDLARAPSPSLAYQAIAPNLVARTLFSGPAGSVSVEIRDILVGPGQTAELPSGASAALIVVQAGSAAVKVDGKTAEPQTGGVFNVPQGQPVEIDNSRETRPFLARTYAFSATGG